MRLNMTQTISELYRILLTNLGPVEARETVSSILYVAIEEIQSEGKEVSTFNLEEKLSVELTNFKKASSKDVA